MFTGLIQSIGVIHHVASTNNSHTYNINDDFFVCVSTLPEFSADINIGDSISVNGACMTAIPVKNKNNIAGTATAATPAALGWGGFFGFEISAQSRIRTCGLVEQGARVNLEKSLTPASLMGGHLVSGHVDGLGRVVSSLPVAASTGSHELKIAIPKHLAHLVAEKGSIAINGVSLTVNAIQDFKDSCEISINVVPHTLLHTTLGELKPDQSVNIEMDMFARYVERMTQQSKSA